MPSLARPPADGEILRNGSRRRPRVGKLLRAAAVVALIAVGCTALARDPATVQQPGTDGRSSALPVRAAFYYPWFPEAWSQGGVSPFTRYTPAGGWYDTGDLATVTSHVESMVYAGLDAGIASWWGQGHHTDRDLPALLEAARGRDFRWTVYYEAEGASGADHGPDPSVAELAADLRYLADRYADAPTWLAIDGRPVLFAYGDSSDGCSVVTRWAAAQRRAGTDFHVVLKVFSGYRGCDAQPDGWHQYGPASAADDQAPSSYTVSPGFWHREESRPRLPRDPARFARDVAAMVDSGARWQLVTTFNEWGEGTSVESAREWASPSGHGVYLDILHRLLARTPPEPSPPPPPSTTTTATSPGTTAPPPGGDSVVVYAAGDLCDDSDRRPGCADTAELVSGADAVLILGDAQYEEATRAEFDRYFDPAWGRYRDITYPVPGNHEYLSSSAAGYFDYFGTRAGDSDRGYYSFDIGAWHVVALNSNCSQVGGCAPDSPQGRWLAADLSATSRECVLAFDHHPAISDGKYRPGTTEGKVLFDALYDHGAEIFLSGHDHNYQRFAPVNSRLEPDSSGVLQIVNGAGGKNTVAMTQSRGILEYADDENFGVVRLTLEPDRYQVEFIGLDGRVLDATTGTCH